MQTPGSNKGCSGKEDYRCRQAGSRLRDGWKNRKVKPVSDRQGVRDEKNFIDRET